MDEMEQLSQLIGDIYDASLDQSLWLDVLERTAGFVGGCAAALMAQDMLQGTGLLHFEWGSDPHYINLYHETYGRLNPLHVPTQLYAEVGAVLASTDLVPHAEIVASRFYKEWLAPQGIVDAVAAILDKSKHSYAVLTIHRHARHGMADDDTRRRMALLGPHFRRAIAIGGIIDLHKVEAAALADTLDGIAAGLFLVDGGARITHVNARGRAMLSDGTVVLTEGDRLSARDASGGQALRDAVAAADRGDQALGVKGVAVPLKGTDGEQWVAHVLPLTSGARRKAGRSYAAAAAVFMRKAALDLPSPLATLADAYRLTAAELRVLVAIVEIGGVPEVAPVLGISETTVKTHLQHVFEKTGVSRQADLVKLVAGFMSPLA
jgi:DNA-binding CsgD family transcriptional regulator